MRTRGWFTLMWLGAMVVFRAGTEGASPSLPQGTLPATNAATCETLAGLAAPNVAISSAMTIPAGSFSPSAAGQRFTVPEFCRVIAVASPSPDSQIAIEVWIPAATAWNGKLLGTANGGFSGAIPYAPMSAALARGYATVGTDTGHTGDQVDFAQGHPEKVTDWAYRAVHVMTDFAKLAVRTARGRAPDRAYFEGCSTGGQQGLSEAQRFPADYDGIVSGDPGHNRVRLIIGFLWGWLALHDDAGKPVMSAAKLPAITRAAVAACGARGSNETWIDDPLSCRFDPAVLACTGDETDTCLTPGQIAAVRKVYEGPRNPRTQEQIFPGWVRGSEQGWGTYLLNPAEPVRIGIVRSVGFGNPAWDFRTFDWDRGVATLDRALGGLAAISTDLGAFRDRGGKIVMYTGLADPVTPPQDTVNYYEAVTKQAGGITPAQAFIRFFPVPGMGHCSGGPSPNTFDALSALAAWVERGVAPDQLIASHLTAGQVDRRRPLCAYPAVARYRGTGDPDAAESYLCGVRARR